MRGSNSAIEFKLHIYFIVTFDFKHILDIHGLITCPRLT